MRQTLLSASENHVSQPPSENPFTGQTGLSAPRRIPFRGLDERTAVEITQRRLPHWTQEAASYFVTFRLADSVPQLLLNQWIEERENWLRHRTASWDAASEREYRERFTLRMDEWTDAGTGECHLRRQEIRREVESVLFHFDGQRYDVDAFALMPNHVHLILTPATGYKLATVLQGIKGVSARRCNTLLGRSGAFWMDESHDHIIRDAEELAAYRNYIADNPKKAGLNHHEYTLQLRHVLEP